MNHNPQPSKYTKSYSSYKRAERKGYEIIETLMVNSRNDKLDINPRFIVAAYGEDRYSPVFVDTGILSLYVANASFLVLS